MRKCFLMLSITMLLATLLMIPGCGGEKAPAGEGGEMDLFSLLPDNAAGVFSVNFKKMTQLDLFDKMIKESEKKEPKKPGELFENYQDFVDKTGIDPKKDIHAMVFGLYGELGGKEPDTVFLANLNYTQNTLLTIIKEKAPGYAEETYNGVAVYKFKDEKGSDMALSFLSENIIAAGRPDLLMKVIDIHKGKGKGITANETMKSYFNKIKSGAIATFVFGFPQEAKKVHDTGMFKMDLTKAEAIVGYIDYADKTWTGEITMISHNEEANQQLVSTLNGLKMMAAAGGPEVEEMVKNMDLKASADSVKLKITLTEELMEKLRAKISGTMTPPPPSQTPEPEEE
jgi:hypothetical protein